MRSVVLGAALALALASAGCRVCSGACETNHGRVVTGIVPRGDGSMVVTSCELTTKGGGSTVSACREAEVPPATATTATPASSGGAP